MTQSSLPHLLNASRDAGSGGVCRDADASQWSMEPLVDWA